MNLSAVSPSLADHHLAGDTPPAKGETSEVKRRRVVAGLGSGAAWPLAAWPRAARAQQPRKTPIIGLLHPGVPGTGSTTMGALRRDIGDMSLIDGRTVRVEERWADGEPDRLPTLARELVALDPAAIIAVARASIEAVRAVSMTVPIVGSDLENDPLVAGYAASFARPGGNVTGLFLDAPAICGKCPTVSTWWRCIAGSCLLSPRC